MHPNSLLKFRRRLKSLTKRNNGIGYDTLKKRLRYYITGWLSYYRMADMKRYMSSMDEWYRRRIRCFIWKQWKRVRTRYANLMRCGISRSTAYCWANTRKSYWRISKSFLHRALTNASLKQRHYPSILGIYLRMHS